MTKAEKKYLQLQRQQARTDAKKDLFDTLDNLVVVSSVLKERIISAYLNAERRLEQIIITSENWTSVDTWIEYQALEKEIKLLNIFSKEFTSMVYIKFYILGNTFNPHADFSKYEIPEHGTK